MPVKMIGVRLGQRPRDPEAGELRHAPGVLRPLLVINDLMGGDGRFHRSSFPPGILI
jgi:hypothetical protein